MGDDLIPGHFPGQDLLYFLILQIGSEPFHLHFLWQKERHPEGIAAAIVYLSHDDIGRTGDQGEHALHFSGLGIGWRLCIVMIEPGQTKHIAIL